MMTREKLDQSREYRVRHALLTTQEFCDDPDASRMESQLEMITILLVAINHELEYMNDSRDTESQDYKESRGGFTAEVKVGGTD